MLKVIRDDVRRGRVLVTDSVVEMCRRSKDCEGKKDLYWTSFYGRRIDSYLEMEEMALSPWPEGTDKVNSMIEEIKHAVPVPTSRVRKMRWSETSGDVDADRAMHGEPAYMRECRRERTHAATVVSIVCTLGGSANVSHEAMFWRGAAVVAAVDQLEAAGYSVEVWGQMISRRTYTDSLSASYVAMKMKEAGNSLELTGLTNAFSAWFCRVVIFGNMWLSGPASGGLGQPNEFDVKRWEHYMDLNSSVKRIDMPTVWDRNSAVEAAMSMLGRLDSV